MKTAHFAMIGMAVLTLPAWSQQLPPVAISDASAAPQVEIPEGAFEIAIPNLGTRSVTIAEVPGQTVQGLPGGAPEQTPEQRIGGGTSDPRKGVRELIRLRRLESPSAPSAQLTQPDGSSISAPENLESVRPEPPLPSAVGLDASASGYALATAAPNPVVARASIAFTLPRAAHTTLVVYDNAGRAVATLADESLNAGTHTRIFDATGLPAGLYLCRLSSEGYAETKTVTVVR